MTDVKRWRATERPGDGAVVEVVDAADHDRIVSSLTEAGVKMQAERDKLAERCRELEEHNRERDNKCARMLNKAWDERDTLRAEVEELRKSQGAEMFLTLAGEITGLRAEVERLTALQLPQDHLPMPRRMLELLIGDPQDPYRVNAESVASEMLSGAMPDPESHERDFSALRNVRLLLAEVDRLRSALSHAEDWVSAAPHGDNCFVSNHYDADPGSRCNCGKDSALEAIDAALEASR